MKEVSLFDSALTGSTLKFFRLNSSGQVALSSGSSWVTFVLANLSTYLVAMPEIATGSGMFYGDWDDLGNITEPGDYSFIIVNTANNSYVGYGDIAWDGKEEVETVSLPVPTGSTTREVWQNDVQVPTTIYFYNTRV